jgi:hypothetical protein
VRTPGNSRILRIIGRDLESRGIKAFVILRDSRRYIVQAGYQTPPAPTPMELEYSLKDIEELERQARELRQETIQPSDIFTLAQALRAVGAYIDKKHGTLTRISNNDGGETAFTIEYEDRDGRRVKEEYKGASLYDMCVSMYKQRGKAIGPGAVFARRR